MTTREKRERERDKKLRATEKRERRNSPLSVGRPAMALVADETLPLVTDEGVKRQAAGRNSVLGLATAVPEGGRGV